MLRFAVVIVLLAAALTAVKREHLLERAGLLGSCSAVSVAGDRVAEWQACRSGRLTGYPDLSRDSCTQQGAQRGLVYWRCPAPLASSPSP